MTTKAHHGMTVGQLGALMFSGDRYPVRSLLGEIAELLSAVWCGQWSEARSEASQISFCLQYMLHSRTGLDMRPRLCRRHVEELVHRHEWWTEFFADYGRELNPSWLRGGSNYRRPEKVELARKAAGLPGYDWNV
jgi:hypothetical protein